MNSTIYPSGVDEASKDLCARKECTNLRTEGNGLCLPCDLRYNTTAEEFEERLSRLLNQRHPAEQVLDIFFAEQRRRSRAQREAQHGQQ